MENNECCSNTDDCCDVEDQEMQMEEIISENNVVLNSLIDLLIEKKIISEEDLQKKIDEMDSELEDECDSKLDDIEEKIDEELETK
ncbi:MAG: hypothetical protein ACOC3X_02770 [Nanoarchaeota archaeon]